MSVAKRFNRLGRRKKNRLLSKLGIAKKRKDKNLSPFVSATQFVR